MWCIFVVIKNVGSTQCIVAKVIDGFSSEEEAANAASNIRLSINVCADDIVCFSTIFEKK